MGQLDSKVVIVTGSDSGIGRGIAIEMAQEGATVVVTYAHAKAKAQEVLETIQKNNGKAIVLQTDVSQYEQAMGLIQTDSGAVGSTGHPGQQCRDGDPQCLPGLHGTAIRSGDRR